MSNVEFSLPIKGVSRGLPVDKLPPSTSGYMKNVRPRDILENRIRIGQRPGLDKLYSQQIGGSPAAIVFVGSITTVS
jgi:hypothetical protein